MDSPGLSVRVGILGADNDARMLGLTAVQMDEVTPIESQHRSTVFPAKREHLLIADCLTRIACFQGRQNVVTQRPQRFNHLAREVLVGVQASHTSVCLVGPNCLFDLLLMSICIGPGIDQVSRSQRWVILQDAGFTPTQPTVVLQHPDRNASAHDAGRASSNVCGLLDAGPCIANIPRQHLQSLDLLRSTQTGQLEFHLIQFHNNSSGNMTSTLILSPIPSLETALPSHFSRDVLD